MFCRVLVENESYQPFAQEWLDTTTLLFNRRYEKECEGDTQTPARVFQTYGFIYEHEWVAVLSWCPVDLHEGSPISCFLSAPKELFDTPAKTNSLQAKCLELWGLFFDEIALNPDWDEWEFSWQEVEHENWTLWYKITRENVALSLEAEALLKQH
jgi:hypothetical protein